MLGPRNELFDAAKYRLLADQLGCPDERWCSEGKWRSKSGPSLADLSTCWRRMEPDDAIQPMEQGRMPKAMRREELEEGELEEGELEEGELEEEAIDVSDYLPMAHQDARTPGRDARWVRLGMLGQGTGKGGFSSRWATGIVGQPGLVPGCHQGGAHTPPLQLCPLQRLLPVFFPA